MLSSSKREGKAVPKLFRMQEAYFSLEGLGFRVQGVGFATMDSPISPILPPCMLPNLGANNDFNDCARYQVLRSRSWFCVFVCGAG